MEPETNEEEVVVEMGKASRLHTITPLSKYLAMILFVILPFLGGWVGYMNTPEKVVEVERVVVKEVVVQESQEVGGIACDSYSDWKEPSGVAQEYIEENLAPLIVKDRLIKMHCSESTINFAVFVPSSIYIYLEKSESGLWEVLYLGDSKKPDNVSKSFLRAGKHILSNTSYEHESGFSFDFPRGYMVSSVSTDFGDLENTHIVTVDYPEFRLGEADKTQKLLVINIKNKEASFELFDPVPVTDLEMESIYMDDLKAAQELIKESFKFTEV